LSLCPEVVTQVGELGSIRRKSDNTEAQKREVTLLDDSRRTVSLTLWGSFATEQGEQLANMVAPVIVVRSLRVSDFNGVSIGTVARSLLVVEPTASELCDKVRRLIPCTCKRNR